MADFIVCVWHAFYYTSDTKFVKGDSDWIMQTFFGSKSRNQFSEGMGQDVEAPILLYRGLVRLLNSLLSRSITLVVRKEIHSPSGKLKKVKQESMDLSKQLVAEGNSSCHFCWNISKHSRDFFLEEA